MASGHHLPYNKKGLFSKKLPLLLFSFLRSKTGKYSRERIKNMQKYFPVDYFV